MRIDLKQNHIIIVLTEAETSFLANKAAASEQKDIGNYIKAKLIKALELKGFEDKAIVDLANNFNLAKIKHVSTELSQRKTTPGNYPGEDQSEVDEEDLIDDLLEEELENLEEDLDSAEEVAAVADDLLSDLLDKDLLKSTKKRQKNEAKTPKERKNSPKPDKSKD